MDKPEALRLAQALNNRQECEDEAAAELRRLHQFAEDQIGRATTAEAALQMTKTTHALKIAAVEAQRDALLAALRTLLSYANVLEMRLLDADGEHRAMQQARAAIADDPLAATRRAIVRAVAEIGKDNDE